LLMLVEEVEDDRDGQGQVGDDGLDPFAPPPPSSSTRTCSAPSRPPSSAPRWRLAADA
jgi:hypothetical protein